MDGDTTPARASFFWVIKGEHVHEPPQVYGFFLDHKVGDGIFLNLKSILRMG